MKTLLIAASAIALTATPAHAQLLGGSGGLGGSLGGSIGSATDISSPIRSTTRTVRSATDSVDSTTRGAVDGNASTDGSQNVDRRGGRVSANRNANAGLTGSVSQLANNPITPVGGTASGSGQASGNGNAEAQLIGTDAVRPLVGRGVSQAGSAVGTARGAAGSAAGQAGGTANGLTSGAMGGASGTASGDADGNGSFTSSSLAVAGSGAANGQGAFGIAPGMPVFAPSGAEMGTVREIVADNRGQVQQIMIEDDGERTLLPADQFSASGRGLVLGSGEGAANVEGDEPESPEPGSQTAAR